VARDENESGGSRAADTLAVSELDTHNYLVLRSLKTPRWQLRAGYKRTESAVGDGEELRAADRTGACSRLFTGFLHSSFRFRFHGFSVQASRPGLGLEGVEKFGPLDRRGAPSLRRLTRGGAGVAPAASRRRAGRKRTFSEA
jgi:hypothetical protein